MQAVPNPTAYLARVLGSHDARVDVDVLYLNEQPRGSLAGTFIDGQVNLQRTEAVKRSGTLTLHDPDHQLHLDAGNVNEGAVYFDRMIRVRHTINVLGVDVTVVPFVGPIVKLSREGSALTVEAQDKSLLAMDGRPPMVMRQGTNAVAAIRAFMSATGERRFRFPNWATRLPRNYAIGWAPEAAPWPVCQQIAASVLGAQLIYSCDGWCTLRKAPTSAVMTYRQGESVTGSVKVDYDASSVRNHARVTGKTPDRRIKRKGKPDEVIAGPKFTRAATAAPSHPMSPSALGRNGALRYLPVLVDDTAIATGAAAQTQANNLLAAQLPMSVTTTWTGVPLYHLDWGDLIALDTPDGRVSTRFVEASLPLGIGGDASLGDLRRISRPRRTGPRALR